jgi:hypothetical protein
VDQQAIAALIAQSKQKQAKVKILVQEGKTPAKVKEAFDAEQPSGSGGRRWPSLVAIIYEELTEKK